MRQLKLSSVEGAVFTTVASTSDVADKLDASQYRTGEGPCLQAMSSGQPVHSRDVATDERWPDLAAEAASTGGSALSCPVADGADAGALLGSLNNYGSHVDAFDDADRDIVVLLTAHLAAVLAHAAAVLQGKKAVMQLTEALQSRDVIGQAKGILMERHRLTAGQAFDVLRHASQRLNRKLRDVAQDVAVEGEPRSH